MRAGWYRTAALAAVLLASLLGAGSALAVTITNFTPTTDWIPEAAGRCVGTSVTINGSGFVTDGGPVAVKFNGTAAVNVVIGSDSVIYAKMAPGTTAGAVTVTTAQGTATSTTSFNPVPCAADAGPVVVVTGSTKPSIASFAPTKAKAGATITITGKNFGDASSVTIGGVAAAFKVASPTKITATVPAKAKTGKVVVTTGSGTATSSNKFTKL